MITSLLIRQVAWLLMAEEEKRRGYFCCVDHYRYSIADRNAQNGSFLDYLEARFEIISVEKKLSYLASATEILKLTSKV